MALDTITFTPDAVDWTYGGAVSHVSGQAVLAANRAYSIKDDATATEDLGALNDGDTFTDWTVVSSTMTKETDGSTPIIQWDNVSFGGSFLSTAVSVSVG